MGRSSCTQYTSTVRRPQRGAGSHITSASARVGSCFGFPLLFVHMMKMLRVIIWRVCLSRFIIRSFRYVS